MKLRFDVDAQRSPLGTLSGFMPRQAEQPGSRHSNPASVKMRSSPSSSACRLTRPEPGTTSAKSEEHTSELQSLMRISYAVFCLKKKKDRINTPSITNTLHT